MEVLAADLGKSADRHLASAPELVQQGALAGGGGAGGGIVEKKQMLAGGGIAFADLNPESSLAGGGTHGLDRNHFAHQLGAAEAAQAGGG